MSEGIALSDLHRTEGDREAFFVELMGGHNVDEAGSAPDAGAGRATGRFSRRGR